MFEEAKFRCQDCERVFDSRPGLWHHTKSIHEGVQYACNQCDYQATTQGSLQRHVQSIHEGFKYPCNQWVYQATQQDHLTTHTQRKHLLITVRPHQTSQLFLLCFTKYNFNWFEFKLSSVIKLFLYLLKPEYEVTGYV